jgi:hypothetical protein
LRAGELGRDEDAFEWKSRSQKLFDRANTFGDEQLPLLASAAPLEIAC